MTDAKNPAPNQAQKPTTDLPEQLRIRRDKRAKLLAEALSDEMEERAVETGEATQESAEKFAG